MPTNDTIHLKTKFSNGTGGEAKLYHVAQLDAEGQPLANPPALTPTSTQATYVKGFTHADDPAIAVGDVDVRVVSKAPTNITEATVRFKDGRTLNSVDLEYSVRVLIDQNPDISSINATSDPIRAL